MAETAAMIDAEERVILAVDNGGTNTRVARGDERISNIEVYATPKDYDEAIGRLAATARVLLNGKRPDAVGVSVAGKVENGRIVSAGELQKNGWTGRPFAEDVAAELGVSPDRVILLNDCAAGANAERTARQPQDNETGAFMVLSTGFGGALYINSELIPDEPGHYYLKDGAVCGDGEEGHIEAHIGGAGIARKYGVRGEDIPHDDPRWQEIKGDFLEGMTRTLKRYEDNGITLQVIGFTGSVALGGPDMLGGLQRDLSARFGDSAPRIEEAIYRDESGLYGAAFAADEALRAA
ncbi:MAG: ROK family protein [Candidatus Saccharimonadales bacterium]